MKPRRRPEGSLTSASCIAIRCVRCDPPFFFGSLRIIIFVSFVLRLAMERDKIMQNSAKLWRAPTPSIECASREIAMM